jgi:nitroreductase
MIIRLDSNPEGEIRSFPIEINSFGRLRRKDIRVRRFYMDAIYKRRSIRKYTKEDVPEEEVLQFIKAGMNAPSAGNQQPWHFIVINDREILVEITKIHPYAQMLDQASCAILVCGDLDLEKHKDYWVQDCSAATQNILLSIADRGFGGVWLGVYPRQDRVEGIRKLLRIPERIVPFALISLGVPAEEKKPRDEFKKERVRYNFWE